jgi:hypothetical protein
MLADYPEQRRICGRIDRMVAPVDVKFGHNTSQGSLVFIAIRRCPPVA